MSSFRIFLEEMPVACFILCVSYRNFLDLKNYHGELSMVRQTVSHYRILEKLGEGGISQSYPPVEGVVVTLTLKKLGALKGIESGRGIL
jgi:hypothetical protein